MPSCDRLWCCIAELNILQDNTIMAAADRFWVNITGRGGHAAMPHLSIDPVIAASQVGSNALLAHAALYSLSCHLDKQEVRLCLGKLPCEWRLVHGW